MYDVAHQREYYSNGAARLHHLTLGSSGIPCLAISGCGERTKSGRDWHRLHRRYLSLPWYNNARSTRVRLSLVEGRWDENLWLPVLTTQGGDTHPLDWDSSGPDFCAAPRPFLPSLTYYLCLNTNYCCAKGEIESRREDKRNGVGIS